MDKGGKVKELSQEIEKYAKEQIVPAINEAPHLAKYIYKSIEKDFKKPVSAMIIAKVKEIVEGGK